MKMEKMLMITIAVILMTASAFALSAEDKSLIVELQEVGILSKLDVELRQAWINPFIWRGLNYNTKVGICVLLSKACKEYGSERITIFDNRSGRQLAKYSPTFGYRPQ